MACNSSSTSPRKRGCPRCPSTTQQFHPVTSKTLESVGYSNKILAGLNDLRRFEQMCDYKLTADGLVMNVHRSVMVACSEYFRAMLTGNMKESSQTEVELKGVNATGLKAVIDFAYTGSINLTLDNLEDVLAAASHLQITEAVELCCQFMTIATTEDNCVDILNLTELYSLDECKQKARGYILANFESISNINKYNQFYKLNHTQMSSLLSENSLQVTSEYNLFTIVLRWIKHDYKARQPHIADLMTQIRLPLLSGEELVEKVSAVSVMHENRACAYLLTQAKDYHIVISKQPLLQSPRTQVRSDKQKLVMCHAENLESYDFQSERHSFLKDSPVPLYNPCVCVVDNFMYVCGGKYDSNENNEIATARCFRYDPRFDTWFELASMNEARKDFQMVHYENNLYAIAGQDENMVMCTVECFSIAQNEWEAKSSVKNAVYGHGGAYCKGLIYICGGQKFDGHCNNTLSYNPQLDLWEDEPAMINARSNHMVACVNDILYALGGNTEDSYGFPLAKTAIESFDPDVKQWTLCQATLNIREAGVCTHKDKIYIAGGINGQHYFTDLIQRYDPKQEEVVFVHTFPTRIYGKAACILTLPSYV